MHIAIAGNIGAGKTTLARLLAKRYGWTPHYEPVDNNPYLEDYYGDMERWSFNLQIYFLNKRFRDVVAIAKSEETVIQDRTIFEDARIFAPNLHDMGLMSDRDFANYTDLFDLMMSLVKLPDLLIYKIQHSPPHRAHPASRPRLRADHPHRLSARTGRTLRGVDQDLPGPDDHRRWRQERLPRQSGRLPAHHRDDRRAALRPVPTRQQGLSLSSTTIDKGGPIAARPCSVSIHLGKVFIRTRSDRPSCHTFSPAYPRFAMSSSVRSMMPAARLSPACTMVTSGESVLAES